jgi:caffeoyl-CoA O-methyltransferase
VFHDMPQAIGDRMAYLESIDARDRLDGTPRLERLRQIPPQTGRFIALLAAVAPAGRYLEIGTSAGYSALWLALACRLAGRRLTTFEILDDKATLARETFGLAGVADVVDLVHGDALDHLGECRGASFCFLDAEKDVYSDCYEAVVPTMTPGGILVADNATNYEAALRPMLRRALSDPRVDAMIVPLDRGDLVCRKL